MKAYDHVKSENLVQVLTDRDSGLRPIARRGRPQSVRAIHLRVGALPRVGRLRRSAKRPPDTAATSTGSESATSCDETADPATRITRERLVAYLDELRRTNRGHTIQSASKNSATPCERWSPESDWRFIKRAAGRLRANTIPARDKRGRLPRIVDVIAQGYRMMDEAEDTAGTLSELGRAALYRDGLLLVFLAYHPLRLRNLASLRIGQHLLVQERSDRP